jgi:hypothetical protein
MYVEHQIWWSEDGFRNTVFLVKNKERLQFTVNYIAENILSLK